MGPFYLFGVKYYSLCKLSPLPFSLSYPQDDVPSQQTKDLTLAAAHIEDAKTGRSVCSIIASCKLLKMKPDLMIELTGHLYSYYMPYSSHPPTTVYIYNYIEESLYLG